MLVHHQKEHAIVKKKKGERPYGTPWGHMKYTVPRGNRTGQRAMNTSYAPHFGASRPYAFAVHCGARCL